MRLCPAILHICQLPGQNLDRVPELLVTQINKFKCAICVNAGEEMHMVK